MARIQVYPLDGDLDGADMLVGTDGTPGVDLNKTKNFTLSDLKNYILGGDLKYKIYTALITQRGASSLASIYHINLTIGVAYQIIDDGGGINHDFTNVGAPNNDFGTYFTATGTTPNRWGTNVYLRYDEGAPAVIVLDNTIGNIFWIYDGVGYYLAESNNLFTEGKTYFSISDTLNSDDGSMRFRRANNTEMHLMTKDNSGNFVDGYLTNTPIEIRVYN